MATVIPGLERKEIIREADGPLTLMYTQLQVPLSQPGALPGVVWLQPEAFFLQRPARVMMRYINPLSQGIVAEYGTVAMVITAILQFNFKENVNDELVRF